MNLNHEYFRVGNDSGVWIKNQTKTAFGEQVPSRKTVFRWYQEFKFGRKHSCCKRNENARSSYDI